MVLIVSDQPVGLHFHSFYAKTFPLGCNQKTNKNKINPLTEDLSGGPGEHGRWGFLPQDIHSRQGFGSPQHCRKTSIYKILPYMTLFSAKRKSDSTEYSSKTKSLVLSSKALFFQRFRPSILYFWICVLCLFYDDLYSGSFTVEAKAFLKETLYHCVRYSEIIILIFIMTRSILSAYHVPGTVMSVSPVPAHLFLTITN